MLEEDDREARVTLLKNLLSAAEDQAKVAKFVDELLKQVDDFMSKFGSTLRSACNILTKALQHFASHERAHPLPTQPLYSLPRRERHSSRRSAPGILFEIIAKPANQRTAS